MQSTPDLEARRRALAASFERQFGKGERPKKVSVAPGRSNLIGEHTDYNGGLVLPIAVREYTAVMFRPSPQNRIALYSETIAESGAGDPRDEFDIKFIRPVTDARRSWANYVRGVANALEQRGVKLAGGDFYITGTLPQGAGLSSSAALEISTGLAFMTMSGSRVNREDIAYAGQEAEHRFAGVRCGIMDQTVVARAKAGHALLLDCQSMNISHIPCAVNGYSFVLFDTGVRHKLAGTEYNKRRAECEHAAEIMGVKTLRGADLDVLIEYAPRLTSNEHKRVRHVLTENIRVAQFAAALIHGDAQELGRLLSLSHQSLACDYEVSCKELDDIVARLAELNAKDGGCPGARMTGGGFGGAVVALVRNDAYAQYSTELAELAKGGIRMLVSSGGATIVNVANFVP